MIYLIGVRDPNTGKTDTLRSADIGPATLETCLNIFRECGCEITGVWPEPSERRTREVCS
jgi:hypothetical protein